MKREPICPCRGGLRGFAADRLEIKISAENKPNCPSLRARKVLNATCCYALLNFCSATMMNFNVKSKTMHIEVDYIEHPHTYFRLARTLGSTFLPLQWRWFSVAIGRVYSRTRIGGLLSEVQREVDIFSLSCTPFHGFSQPPVSMRRPSPFW